MLRYLQAWMGTTALYRAIKSEEGQDLAEYALLIALIAIVVVVAVAALGDTITNAFNGIAADIGI